MRDGGLFLADEISLADDSVLERLNSLLEPERKLLLAEKGSDEENSNIIVAQENFHFIGTMNPGGDFGKKELSPALRNRFTEIWCEAISERKDLLAIIEQNLKPGLFVGNQEDGTSGVGNLLLDFLDWFTRTDVGKRLTFSIRDIITWVNFINVCTEDPESKATDEKKLSLPHAYVHGALIVFLDGLGCGVTSRMGTQELQQTCEAALKYLSKQVEFTEKFIVTSFGVVSNETHFGVHPYYVQKGNTAVAPEDFVFTPDVTVLNISRVLRGLQLGKPILLEGGPGDISDLFGADLPVEGGEGGQFAWRDGPFLRALKAGHWILLDELNLASQSVLEGLNACLDHRGEVYIPELGKTFHIQSGNTHIFGAQNPVKEGGARRGLPQSFLNRFTQVFVETMTDTGMISIMQSLFPVLPNDLISRMVSFNCHLTEEIELRHLGQQGAPWDFNIRDLCRWSEIIVDDYKNQTLIECEEQPNVMFNPGKFVDLIYADRMRTKLDKEKVLGIYRNEFGSQYPLICDFPRIHMTPSTIFIDDTVLSREGRKVQAIKDDGIPDMIQGVPQQENNLILLRRQFPALRSLARCINMNWLAILVS
ncbi:Midasin [Blattella germanica]|nr:Midasin [Blattella germanica]